MDNTTSFDKKLSRSDKDEKKSQNSHEKKMETSPDQKHRNSFKGLREETTKFNNEYIFQRLNQIDTNIYRSTALISAVKEDLESRKAKFQETCTKTTELYHRQAKTD